MHAFTYAAGPITVSMAYNALGWATEVVYPGLGETAGFTVTYGYTPLGHRAAVTDALGVLTYAYDALYRPVDIAAPTGGAQYRYDALGQRTHLVYPTGNVVTYTHDAAGRLRTVTDWAGQTTRYTYTAAGRLAAVQLPNGIRSEYGHDAAGRLGEITHRQGETRLAHYQYALDAVGNRTAVSETWRALVAETGVAQAGALTPGDAVWEDLLTLASAGSVGANSAPAVAYAPAAAQYLVVWSHFGGFGEGQAILGRLLDSSGKLGTPFTIAPQQAGIQAPRVAYDSLANTYLVVWQRDNAIYGRLVSPDGHLGEVQTLVAYGNTPHLAAHPDTGGYLLVYNNCPLGGGTCLHSPALLALQLNLAGNPQGPPTQLAAYIVPAAAVTYDAAAAQYLVVWEQATAPSGLYGRLVGDTLGTTFLIQQNVTQPAVAYNPQQGRSLVTWLTANGLVAGRQVGAGGSYLGPVTPFSPAAQTPERPVVGGNGTTDNWLVVWRTTAPQFQVVHGAGPLSGAQQSFTTPPLAAGDTLAVSSAPAAASGLQLVVWSRAGKHIEARYFRPLDAGFRAAPAAGTRQPTVVFTDTTAPLDQADTWAWNFGDGHGSAAQHPQHTYPAPGVYTVTLTASARGSGESESLTLPHAITVTSLLHSHVITYTYDPLQRLTAAAYSTGETYGYAYDAVGNRTVMTDATGVHLYVYDAANRLTGVQLPDSSVQTYTWDARGNLLTDGANTYTYNSAGRMIRAANLDATLVYTYTADGLRVQQAANDDVTAFTWDWAAPVPELLSDGARRYLVGHDTLGEQSGNAWRYYLPDALGSARQSVDAAGDLVTAREWTPYGEEVGVAQAGLGFTGEWFDAAVGLQYLRARWYQPGTGRFISRDPWEGYLEYPLSQHAWLYVYANPLMFVDPSGYEAGCPIGRWDCEAVRNVRALKQAFLNSASRHNKIPTMDDNGFAGLLAATIVSERRIGNRPATGKYSGSRQWLENRAMEFGCVVSGHYLSDAWEQRDASRFWDYWTNQEIPQYATVGIGNVWLNTAANLWKGQACSSLGECTPVHVTTLQTENTFGWTVDINNPFGPQIACASGGNCASYEPTEVASYQILGRQLLDKKMNIEYVAANLEAGALRAQAKGYQPSAFNAASWHLRGLQADDEIERAQWNPGGAVYILDDIPTALQALELTSSWQASDEEQYVRYAK